MGGGGGTSTKYFSSFVCTSQRTFHDCVQALQWYLLATVTHSVFLSVLDPLDGLSLRVYHERPAVGDGHDDSVLSGEGVRGEPLNVPVPNDCGLGQEGCKGEVWSTGDAELTDLQWETYMRL